VEWQRVVELYSGGDEGLHGSGYLLASGLALTARHVVEGLERTELRLLMPDSYGLPGTVGDWQPAEVAWLGGSDLDLALLVTAGVAFGSVGRPAMIGRLDGRAPVRVDGLGFPRAMETPTHSDTLHINATVNAWSGIRDDAMLLAVQTSKSNDATGWKGMSGAAIFGGDRLVGVVEKVPAKLDRSTLRATPTFGMFDDECASGLLRRSEVVMSPGFVDADYVARLPRSGNWYGLRANYARAVLNAFCRIDHVGMAVVGSPDVRIPALSTYTDRQLRWWPAAPTNR
jgi:hypothetical protein